MPLVLYSKRGTKEVLMPGKQFRTILVPTDFSEPSGQALDLALGLVEPGGTLILIHVVDDIPLTYGYVGVASTPAELRARVDGEATRELQAFGPAASPSGIALDRRLLHGTPYMAIVQEAQTARADLIVMGTHGRTGLKHILIGSVAEKVVRKAGCPVLVVRPPEHGSGTP
jgi:nucleotide-binding universal stress UspA family protein